jgi:hypothetical protein
VREGASVACNDATAVPTPRRARARRAGGEVTNLGRKVGETDGGLHNGADEGLGNAFEESDEAVALPPLDRVRDDTRNALPRAAEQVASAEAEALEDVAGLRRGGIRGVLLNVLFVERDVREGAAERAEHCAGKVGEPVDPIVRQVHRPARHAGVDFFEVREADGGRGKGVFVFGESTETEVRVGGGRGRERKRVGEIEKERERQGEKERERERRAGRGRRREREREKHTHTHTHLSLVNETPMIGSKTKSTAPLPSFSRSPAGLPSASIDPSTRCHWFFSSSV